MIDERQTVSALAGRLKLMSAQSINSPPKILVVDDHEDNRFLVKHLLESKGYFTLEAANGLEAIDVARAARPRLIFMDRNLPALDGITATRRIRADKQLRDISIVILSGHVTPQDKAVAFAAGCDGYITKPIDFTEFYTLLERLLPADSNATSTSV